MLQDQPDQPPQESIEALKSVQETENANQDKEALPLEDRRAKLEAQAAENIKTQTQSAASIEDTRAQLSFVRGELGIGPSPEDPASVLRKREELARIQAQGEALKAELATLEGLGNAETAEQNESRGQEIYVESKAEAYSAIAETFRQELRQEYGREGREPLEYHRPEHSEDVANWTVRGLEAIRQAEEEFLQAYGQPPDGSAYEFLVNR